MSAPSARGASPRRELEDGAHLFAERAALEMPPRCAAHYTERMSFRDRLLATLRAVAPVLRVDGVLIAGSEVPNLLEADAAASLVISQDVDLAIPVSRHPEAKAALKQLSALRPSAEEPSVWLPLDPALIEVNLIGMDPSISDASESYVLEDAELPLLVFGYLSLLEPAEPLNIDGLILPVPRVAGLLLEKLLSERSGEKGERDLLVALGLMLVASDDDLQEAASLFRRLDAELRHAARANLTVLSLMRPHAGMPDPSEAREQVAALLRLFDAEPGA